MIRLDRPGPLTMISGRSEPWRRARTTDRTLPPGAECIQRQGCIGTPKQPCASHLLALGASLDLVAWTLERKLDGSVPTICGSDGRSAQSPDPTRPKATSRSTVRRCAAPRWVRRFRRAEAPVSLYRM